MPNPEAEIFAPKLKNLSKQTPSHKNANYIKSP